MAGHSKWANIQHRKGAQDKKRGKIFTKCIKEIGVAARMGGSSDPAANPRLRLAVDKALAANMPKDTIERAAKKGAGELEGDAYVEVRYEGYGPGGVAVMVDCLTDNHIRTVADVRHAFSKCNGNLGTDGSVAYLFSKLGVLHFAPGVNQDRLMEFALEAGADDLIASADGSVEVITNSDDFSDIKDKIIAAGFKPELAEVTMRAATSAELDVEAAQKMIRLTEMLDDLDDVQQVYSNADIAEEILAQL